MPRFLHFPHKGGLRTTCGRMAALFRTLLCRRHRLLFGRGALRSRGLLSLPKLGIIDGPRYDAGPRYFVFPEEPKIDVRPLATIKRKKAICSGECQFFRWAEFQTERVVWAGHIHPRSS